MIGRFAWLLFAVALPSLLLLEPVAAQDEARAQSILGTWQGVLDTGRGKLRLVVHLSGEASALKAKLDSPDQGVTGIAIDTVSFEEQTLRFGVRRLGAKFEGKLGEDGKIHGTFSQGGKMPMVLEKVDKVVEPRRPQTPKAPFPYDVEEVAYSHDPNGDTAKSLKVEDASEKYTGKERVCLSATLTLPRGEGPHPAAILVSGSGPQDRDETIFAHRPFHVIADALTRQGIAVLRFDDRGVGRSTGSFGRATTRDFAADTYAGIRYLMTRKEIAGKKIGVIGHSEGGLVAAMLAAQYDDVAFVITLAGPAVSGAAIINHQMRLMARLRGATDEAIEPALEVNRQIFKVLAGEGEVAKQAEKVRALLGEHWDDAPKMRGGLARDAFVRNRSARVLSPWFRFFANYDPRADLAKIRVPFLGLFGKKDCQVDPKQNLEVMLGAVANGTQDNACVAYAKLNHLFQECETGAVEEYGKIEQTIAPVILEKMAKWIRGRTE